MSDHERVFKEVCKLLIESSLFDSEYYLKNNNDVAAAGIDPLKHFLLHGGFEGRSPSRLFDTKFYMEQCPDVAGKINPLVHYLVQGRSEGLLPTPPRESLCATRGAYFEQERMPAGMDDRVRLIAFYLPQYHPIPENDRHWGKGFTEWTNVSRAIPVFEGHYQPRLPGELGFYDLRMKDVLRRQMEQAKQCGIHGFCLHHYWFNGKKVLRTPLEHILADKSLDLPFCLHWANESWTKRWDGSGDSEIIIQQWHSPEDDIRFIEDIESVLRDDRYIRIEGKPLLAVYRADEFPDLRATVLRWREYCQRKGVGEIYVAMSESFGNKDPYAYGCDAAIEYPPHNLRLPSVRSRKAMLDDSYHGLIRAYDDAMRSCLDRPLPEHTLFRGVIPGWDNSSRTKFGQILADSSPANYQYWLEEACRLTLARQSGDERIVFLNAWNEWAEGAYLEADSKYGYAYLNATARAKQVISLSPSLDKVLFVVPTATEADEFTLNLLRQAKASGELDVKLILLTGGSLLEEFGKVAELLVLDEVLGDFDVRMHRVWELCQGRLQFVLGSSPVVGEFYEYLAGLSVPIVTIFRPDGRDVRRAIGLVNMRKAAEKSNLFITFSQADAATLSENHEVPYERIVHAQGQTSAEIFQEIVGIHDKMRRPHLPFISVIVITNNDGLYLKRTLDAILGQSFQDFELICVDNGCTDGTDEVLKQYQKRHPLSIMTKKNCRDQDAVLLTEALEKAHGELVWVVRPGDVPTSIFLEQMTPCFSDRKLALAYCAMSPGDEVDETPPAAPGNASVQGRTLWKSGYRLSGDSQMIEGLAFDTEVIPAVSATLFRRSMLGEFASIAPKLRIYPYWHLYLDLLARGDIAYIPTELVEHGPGWKQQRVKDDPEQALREFDLACQFILTRFRIDQKTFVRMLARGDELFKKARTVNPQGRGRQALNKTKLVSLFDHKRGETVRRPQRIFSVFRDHSNEEWLRILCRSVHSPIIDGVQMPTFPPRELQIGMVGSAYEETMQEVFLFYKEIHSYMKRLNKPFDYNTTICDFGCGFGRIYRFFLKDVPQENIVGVDVDPSFLQICSDTLPMGKFYANSPCPPLDFKDNCFDIVYSYSVFSHLEEQVSLSWIDELHRVLKPGGVLFVTIRQMEFLKQCHALKEKQDLSLYERNLSEMFDDFENLCQRYEDGEFIYKAMESSGVRSSDFYGDCVIPKEYVELYWAKKFRLVDCFEDPTRLAQSLVVLQKSFT